jgi:glucuronoarabinoxylan endo-1,4-beta-xylanase
MTSGIGKRLGIACVPLFVCLVSSPALAQSATITWTNTHQTMDGWGGEDWISGENLTSSQADLFFSPSAGIGLEIIRTGNYDCPNTGDCAVSTSNVPDLKSLQEAVARGAKVELSIQSPPANVKYSGTFTDGTAGADSDCLDTSKFSAYASFMVDWTKMLNSNQATVSYLDVANEANLTQGSSLGACQWTAAGLDRFIGSYLGPAMSSAGLLGSVQIMMPSSSGWFGTVPDLSSKCLNDSTCNQYVKIASAHGYGSGNYFNTGYCCAAATNPGAPTTNFKIWMSEINGGSSYNSGAGLWSWDASMSDALEWARNIHDYLTTVGVSGWLYWQLADCCSGESGAPFNDGLTDANFNTSKRYYVVGNWSKYVRSGWVRIDATPSPAGGIYVTAFKENASGKFAVVAVNENSSSANVSFSLASFPPVRSVTPTLTSASVNLADQPSVAVSNDSFSYALPSASVVTFHNASSSGGGGKGGSGGTSGSGGSGGSAGAGGSAGTGGFNTTGGTGGSLGAGGSMSAGGSAGTSTAAGGTAGTNGSNASANNGSCGCTAPGREPVGSGALALLSWVGLVVLRRRRGRRRTRIT